MPRTILKLFAGTLLLVASQACAPTIPPTPDPDAINTAIAQTGAAQTQTPSPVIPVTSSETPTPTVTTIAAASPTAIGTAVQPTVTQASSPTPMLTPGVAQVSVSVPTNCRTGPGVAYPRVGALLVGEIANVVGRNASGNYWIIQNPDRVGETCWLWGQYATLTGETSALAVFTPPPRPTPVSGFDASFEGVESCTNTGNRWLDIALENNGNITFQSFSMTVTDTVTGTDVSLSRDNFIDRDGCNVDEDQGDLDPGDTLIVSSPNLASDPAGRRMRVRVTVCSNPGQSGTCLTETIEFTP